jgi:hypothetical protein
MTATISAPEDRARASLIGDWNPGMLVVVIPDCVKGVKILVVRMDWHRCGEMPSGVIDSGCLAVGTGARSGEESVD